MLSNEYEQLCFICYRVADIPTPRASAVQLPCAGCNAPIWVPVKSPSVPPKICIRCIDDSTKPTA
jgi:hypothetical protein